MARPSSSRVPSASYTRRMTTLSSTRRRSVGTRITVHQPSFHLENGAQPISPPVVASTEPESPLHSRRHLRRACAIPVRYRDRGAANQSEASIGPTPEAPPVGLEHGEDQTSPNPGRFSGLNLV